MNRSGVCVSLCLLFFISLPIAAQHAQGSDIQRMYNEKQKEKVTATYLHYIEAILAKSFWDMSEAGMKFGVFAGVQHIVGGTIEACSTPLVQGIVKPVSSCIKYPFTLTNKWLQFMVFGSRRLAWNDVAKLNNILFDVIQPLTVQSLGDFTKERRAELIAAKQENQIVEDKDWLLKRNSIIDELDYVIKVINGRATCYSAHDSQNFARRLMGNLYGFFSVEQRDEIAYSLNRAAIYCSHIKDLLKGMSTAKELEEHRDLLKFLLCRVLKSFKSVASFINEDLASMPAGSYQQGYLKFQELSAQSGGGSLAGLDALFGGDGNTGPSGN